MNQRMTAFLSGLADRIGYEKMHITRIVAYREIDAWLTAIGVETKDALEISAGWKWRRHNWRSYTEMNWPQHDICGEHLDKEFDVIIADNVFEHLKFPYRAARHVLAMLRPGGWFINITPFLIRYHPIPLDCTRWTETGMRYFLEESGFQPDSIVTGSWGNVRAVKRNLHRWARVGWRRSFPHDERFPVTVWAIARKAEVD